MPRKKKPERRVRGTGSISVDRKTGVIRARVTVEGEEQRRSKKFRPGHRADAEAWIAAQLNPAPTVAGITLRDWAGSWWETYVEPIRPPNTAKGYLYALKQLDAAGEDPAVTSRLIDTVRTSMLQAAVAALAKRLDAATVQGIVGVWRRCFEAAIEDDLIARNPARSLSLPTAKKRMAKRHVTAEEVAILWPAIRGHRFEAAYALILGMGLRIGAILGLHWEHVDFVGRRIWVQHQFTNGHWRDEPKGHNPHWEPMPDRVAAALIRHRNAQPPGCALVMQSDAGRRRKRARGAVEPRPWSRQVVANDLAAIVAGLELDPITPHAGRRGLVTVLLDGGVSPAVIAERVGHADASTTMKFYPRVSRQSAEQADRLVARYLGDDERDADSAC